MTAIITKQNAKDKAFIGGGGDGSTDGLFNSLHVLGDTTLDGAVTFTESSVRLWRTRCRFALKKRLWKKPHDAIIG